MKLVSPLLEEYIGTRKLTPGNHRLAYPSKKMGRQLITESPNECNFAEFLEADSRVRGFISQPRTITYDLYQIGHQYTADFFADFYLLKPTFYEIKPKGFVISEEDEDKFYEIEKVFNNMGFNFTLVTGDYIEKGARLKNFKKMRAQVGKIPGKNTLDNIQSYILGSKNHQISFGNLINQLVQSDNIKRDKAVVYVYQCLANRIIGFDICLGELNDSTTIGLWDESFNRTWDAVLIQE